MTAAQLMARLAEVPGYTEVELWWIDGDIRPLLDVVLPEEYGGELLLSAMPALIIPALAGEEGD